MFAFTLLLLAAPLPASTPSPSITQGPAWAQPPLSYGESEPTDVVAQLNAFLAEGTSKALPSDQPATIEAVLEALSIPASSQVAVFSGTSMQARRITPARPRTLYFNDDVYVGFVPGGGLIEVIAIDPNEGMNFYSLDRRAKTPRFQRETDRCLQCHAPSRNGGLPALLLRSVHPHPTGEPNFGGGSSYVDPTTPFEKRWGGWYVTGDAGDMRHIGNRTLQGEAERLVPASTPHKSLGELCRTTPYPAATSDIVALLVLEHQVHVHNAIAWGAYEARRAIDYQRVLNKALGEPAEAPVQSSESRLNAATERIVDALIGLGEVPLPDSVGERSRFAREFQARGVRDDAGRSLRDLNLKTRVFQYPMSFLVDSEAMRNLPEPLSIRVWARLAELFGAALGPADATRYGSLLDAEARTAVREILRATVPGKL